MKYGYRVDDYVKVCKMPEVYYINRYDNDNDRIKCVIRMVKKTYRKQRVLILLT